MFKNKKLTLSVLTCIAIMFLGIGLGGVFSGTTSVINADASVGSSGNEYIISFYPIHKFPYEEQNYIEQIEDLKNTCTDQDDEWNKRLLRICYEETNENWIDRLFVVDSASIAKKYEASKYVEYVEINYIAQNFYIPNDIYYDNQSTALELLNAPNGWDITNSSSATIAIIDSGVINHPDLPEQQTGHAVVSGLSPASDTANHGTGVAGAAGAIGNNYIGGTGINMNASIMSVKVDDANGTISIFNVAKGIEYAVNNGAKVLNLSLGTDSDSFTLRNAINNAYNSGCVLVAASGNVKEDESANRITYPAKYDKVLAVGATENGKTRASWSYYGEGLDVVAMGNYITTNSAGSYSTMSGTSFASPQVAGLASLILDLKPDATNEEVYQFIKKGAKMLGAGYNTQTGYGLIDVYKTLLLAQGKQDIISLSDTEHTFDSMVYDYAESPLRTITVSNYGEDNTGELSVSVDNSDYFIITNNNLTGGISGGSSASFCIKPKTGLHIGAYTATVTVSGDAVVSKSFTVSFTVTAKPSVTITSNNLSFTYNGNDINLSQISELFLVNPNSAAGTRVYSVENKDGTHTGQYSALDGAYLRVTKAGTFRIGLETQESPTHQAGAKKYTILTVNKANGAALSGYPTVTSISQTSIQVSATLTTDSNAQQMEYAISTTNLLPTTGWQQSNSFDELDESTEYFVFARSKENDLYNTGQARYCSTQTQLPVITPPPPSVPTVNEEVVYFDGITLNDVPLPAGWNWEEPSTSLYHNQGVTQNFVAIYAGNESYSAAFETVSFIVNKADQTNDIVPQVLSDNIVYKQNFMLNEIALTEGWEWQNPHTILEAGNNQLFVAVLRGNDNYNDILTQLAVTISKAQRTDYPMPLLLYTVTYEAGLTLDDILLIDDWVWEKPEDCIYHNDGELQTFKVLLQGDKNYQDIYLNVDVKVQKGSVSLPEIIYAFGQVDLSSQEITLENITLPEGWEWVDPDTVITSAQSTYSARYIGDTENFNDPGIVQLTIVLNDISQSDGDDPILQGNGLEIWLLYVTAGAIVMTLTVIMIARSFRRR